MSDPIETAITLLEERRAARESAQREHAQECVRLYLALLADPDACPAVLADVAADCGFNADDIRAHRAKLVELGETNG